MTPDQLSTTIVDVLTALVADGVRHAARRRPDLRDRGATAAEGSRRLRHQRRAAAGEEGRHEPARLRRAGAAAGSRRPRASPRSRSPGPGFLNITVDAGRPGPGRGGRRRRRRGVRLAPTRSPARRSTSSSSRPTRPARCTSARVRWAAVGDALGRIFTMTGAEVTREYYFNDHGAQIDRFSSSLLAWRQGRAGARGRLRRASTSTRSPRTSSPQRPEVARPARRRGAGGLPRRGRRDDVRRDQAEPARLRRRLRRLLPRGRPARGRGAVERAIDAAHASSATPTRQDGALWLRTEKFGDDKDRVIIKSDGRGAYLSGDLAYYLDKRERGFDRCFIMLGADHHGYVGRMMAMCAAFGDEPGTQPRDPDRPDGQPAARRPAAADVQAGRHRRHASTTWSTRSASTPPATPWPATARDSNIDLDLDLWAQGRPTTTRSTTCSTATPAPAG